MNLSVLIVAGLLCTVINFAFAIVTLRKQFRITKGLGYPVSPFALLTALWCLFRTITLTCQPQQALFWDRFSLSIALLCVSTVLIISYLYSGKKLQFVNYIVAYLPAIIFAIVGFTSIGIREIISVIPLKKLTGFGYTIAILWLVGVLIYVLYRSISNLSTLRGLRKLQQEYFLIGVIFYVSVAIILGGLLPLLNVHAFIPYIPLFSIIWIATTVYSLSAKFIGVEFLIYTSVKLFLVLVGGIAFNIVLTNIFEKVFLLGRNISVGISVGIFMLLLSIYPLRVKIKATLETLILKKRVKYQNLLSEISKAVISILDIDKLLDYIVESIRNTLGAERITVFVLDKLNGEEKFKLHASCGLTDLKTNYFTNKRIIEFIKTNKEPFIIDTTLWKFPSSEHREILNDLSQFGAILIVPLVYKNDLLGLMTLDEKKTNGTVFDLQDIEILQTLSNNLAVAIRNAKLYKEVEDAYFNITKAFVNVLETKDIYSIGHSDSVTKYSVAIAKKLNLPSEDIIVITQAAMLHDLGKIGIHDYVLTKEGALTQQEWEEIKLHSLKGVEILKPLPFLKEVSDIIKHHHEHYDGSGYPDKLKHEQIPLGSQILSVADAFDAMITDRPYRKPKKKLTVKEAVEELKKNSGIQFNPKIVEIFLKVIDENPNIILSQRITEIGDSS
ncbi:MAG: HD domain-containing protein [Elusimicrobiota bacterium]|nr:HD domain-containing protein [Elusimicrobiota bacterium]